MLNLAHDRLLELLGCTAPVVLAGMGGVSRSDLVAAVAAAGGFGFLGMVREPPELIAREVERLTALGHRRFGVNIVPAATDPVLLERQVVTCIRLAVPVVATFWDLDERLTRRLRDAGIVVVHQVGSVDEAIAAERAGVEIIIAQGCEAGGHVRGTRPLRDLLPEVADAVGVPVLAAGGLANGGDLVTATALGAAGIVLGTAMLATHEAFAHPYHKQRLLAAEATDTVLNGSFYINWPPAAPVRTLKSAVTAGGRGDPHTHPSFAIGAEGDRPIYLFSTDSPLRSMRGDFESMALYAGTGVGRIVEITPAGDRLQAVLREAAALLAIPAGSDDAVELSSPVCYAQEMSGPYMGVLSDAAIVEQLDALAAGMRAALGAVLRDNADPHAASQPPFADAAVSHACWVLHLRRLANERRGAVPPAGALLQHEPLADLVLLHHALLHRLGTTIPQLAEPTLTRQLIDLMDFLRGTSLAAGQGPSVLAATMRAHDDEVGSEDGSPSR